MRREQVFWGWGEPGTGASVSQPAIAFLGEALGIDGGVVEQPVALEDVRLRDPALEPAVRARLAAIVTVSPQGMKVLSRAQILEHRAWTPPTS